MISEKVSSHFLLDDDVMLVGFVDPVVQQTEFNELTSVCDRLLCAFKIIHEGKEKYIGLSYLPLCNTKLIHCSCNIHSSLESYNTKLESVTIWTKLYQNDNGKYISINHPIPKILCKSHTTSLTIGNPEEHTNPDFTTTYNFFGLGFLEIRTKHECIRTQCLFESDGLPLLKHQRLTFNLIEIK